jgi:hypothetical protein
VSHRSTIAESPPCTHSLDRSICLSWYRSGYSTEHPGRQEGRPRRNVATRPAATSPRPPTSGGTSGVHRVSLNDHQGVRGASVCGSVGIAPCRHRRRMASSCRPCPFTRRPSVPLRHSRGSDPSRTATRTLAGRGDAHPVLATRAPTPAYGPARQVGRPAGPYRAGAGGYDPISDGNGGATRHRILPPWLGNATHRRQLTPAVVRSETAGTAERPWSSPSTVPHTALNWVPVWRTVKPPEDGRKSWPVPRGKS